MAQEALGRLSDEMLTGIDQVLAEEQDEAEQLRLAVKLMCRRYAKARPPFYRDLETTPSLTTLLEEARKRAFAKLDAVLAAGIERGRFRADLDPRLVRMTLLAACDTIIHPQVLTEDEAAAEASFKGIMDIILGGVLGKGQTLRAPSEVKPISSSAEPVSLESVVNERTTPQVTPPAQSAPPAVPEVSAETPVVRPTPTIEPSASVKLVASE
ncbi:TetR/AcrR family transcriptional regulator C-terminal domain-containing protein [Pseudenhygromyxa sp. WMMC2535]|uniref:TetR/AcrR family transcriptional regulator C-terminal domain-containing protein n=1 Tax=Pseudenhygromyxa sp. WMMC2535 TaxID=2712867 RepID=UPI0031FA02FA